MIEHHQESLKAKIREAQTLAVISNISYQEIMMMTEDEWIVLADILKEKAEIESGKKKPSSMPMTSGRKNMPPGW